jgi:hypothetical protein
MTVFDNIKSKNIDELSKWLDEYGMYDCSPWSYWFDKSYCSKCESVIAPSPCSCNVNSEYAWCELNNHCRYFEEMNHIPNNEQVIKMWLESEFR